MTPGQEEARDASLIFHAAMIRFGLGAVAEALDLWSEVQPLPARAGATGARWLARMLSMLAFRRQAMRDLAYSYYRYTRALHTGYTLPPLDGDGGETTGLNSLREDFFSQVEELDPELLNEDRELVDDDGVIATHMPPTTDDEITVEEPGEDLADLLDELDETAEQEARDQLWNVGPSLLETRLAQVDTDRPAREVDAEREDLHDDLGARVASAAERVAMNAARQAVTAIARQDSRVIGYVRASGTGSPCGWCAMLISRGVVYRSEETAGEDNTWHDNCHCYAEPVFSLDQYENDSRFDLNREFSALWPEVTRGLRGKQAISAWRRFIRHEWNPDALAAAA